jgi:hypothetical protein
MDDIRQRRTFQACFFVMIKDTMTLPPEPVHSSRSAAPSLSSSHPGEIKKVPAGFNETRCMGRSFVRRAATPSL